MVQCGVWDHCCSAENGSLKKVLNISGIILKNPIYIFYHYHLTIAFILFHLYRHKGLERALRDYNCPQNDSWGYKTMRILKINDL